MAGPITLHVLALSMTTSACALGSWERQWRLPSTCFQSLSASLNTGISDLRACDMTETAVWDSPDATTTPFPQGLHSETLLMMDFHFSESTGVSSSLAPLQLWKNPLSTEWYFMNMIRPSRFFSSCAVIFWLFTGVWFLIFPNKEHILSSLASNEQRLSQNTVSERQEYTLDWTLLDVLS